MELNNKQMSVNRARHSHDNQHVKTNEWVPEKS